jgi:hypothetical protein
VTKVTIDRRAKQSGGALSERNQSYLIVYVFGQRNGFVANNNGFAFVGKLYPAFGSPLPTGTLQGTGAGGGSSLGMRRGISRARHEHRGISLLFT